MRFTVSQDDLSFHLGLVSRAVPSRPSGHPILSNVLIEAQGESVSLTGFDLSLGIRTVTVATVEETGTITVPAQLLTEIVSRQPSGSLLSFACEGESVTLSSLSGSYSLRGLSAEEFPELPTSNATPVVIPGKSLLQGAGVSYAASTDETKQVLCGVHLTALNEALECACTDGHRLAVSTQECAEGADFEATIPSRSLKDLVRILGATQDDGDVRLSLESGLAVFEWGSCTLTTRTLDGQYPQYRQLIPTRHEIIATFKTDDLLKALDRVAVVASQKSNVVKLSVTTMAAIVSVEAQDVGNAQESVCLTCTGEIEIAFNVKYLQDAIKNLGATEALLKMNSPVSPVVVCPVDSEDRLALVMPVQIRS